MNNKIISLLGWLRYRSPYIQTTTGRYQGWQELSDFQMFGTFLITQADAKAYMYAISPLRRVHRFRDIQVNLYI